MLANLNLILALPARGVWASRVPVKVLAGEAVSRFELVEAGGEALVGSSHRLVQFLFGARAVFRVCWFGEVPADPAPGLRPFFLRGVALEVGEGPRERETSHPDYAMRVREVEPLRSVSVRFAGGHPPDGGLCICEDVDRSERVVPG